MMKMTSGDALLKQRKNFFQMLPVCYLGYFYDFQKPAKTNENLVPDGGLELPTY